MSYTIGKPFPVTDLHLHNSKYKGVPTNFVRALQFGFVQAITPPPGVSLQRLRNSLCNAAYRYDLKIGIKTENDHILVWLKERPAGQLTPE